MNSVTVLQMIKPWLAQAARDTLRMLGMYLLSKHIIQGGDAGVTAFVGAGMTFAGFAWGWFTTFGMVKLAAFFKTMQDAAKTPASPSAPIVGTVVKALIVALALSVLLGDHSAFAQGAKPRGLAVTGNPIKDIRTDLGIPENAGVTKNADGTIKCDFNIFLLLNRDNLEQVIKACVTEVGSTLVQDTEIALQSAQNFTQSEGGAQGDIPAVQCLTPGLAILKAGIPRPAVDAVPAQAATPTTAAVPAVAAQPAYNPGLLTLFQKLREFGLKGGPAACDNWIKGTVTAVAPPAAAAAAGVVGAAIIAAPK